LLPYRSLKTATDHRLGPCAVRNSTHARSCACTTQRNCRRARRVHATGELPPIRATCSSPRAWASKMPQPAPGGEQRPSLRLAVAVERWRIIFHDTAEHVHEELNRLVVLPHNDTDQFKTHGSDYFLEPSDPMVRSLSWRHDSDWARPVVHWSIVALDRSANDPSTPTCSTGRLGRTHHGDPAGIGAGAGPRHIQAGANPGMLYVQVGDLRSTIARR